MERIRRLQKAFSESTGRRGYYFLYTILFLTMAALCYSYFIFSGRSLIWLTDGWTMHFKALFYYSQYLRTIFRHLIFDHQLIIPDWDFYIGEGNDIIGTLHGYAIGDPIAFLSVFVPAKYMHYYFTFASFLRFYMAGIAFSELCFGTEIKNRYGILAGTLAYVFCGRSFVHCVPHPEMINPLIYLPLLILGVEIIIRKKKPYLFIVSIGLLALCNMYFFYICALLTVVYVLIRLFILYNKDVKSIALNILSFGGYSVIGVCISGVILLPEIFFLFSDSRASSDKPFSLLYPMAYYSSLPGIAISEQTSYELYLGLAAPAIIVIFLLFRKRGAFLLYKLLFVASVLILFFPTLGSLLNGMSYAANRWSFALTLLCTYVLSKLWDELLGLQRKEWAFLLICSLAYYVLILHFDKSRSAGALSSVPFLFITLIVLFYNSTDNLVATIKSLSLVGVIMASAVNLAFWSLSSEEGITFSEYVENEKVWDEWENNEARVVKALTANIVYPRYTGSSLVENANMINEISNTQFYWSVSNAYMNNYRRSLSMRELIPYSYEGYDDRTTPIALTGSQYYVARNGASSYVTPYGFDYLDTFNSNITGDKMLEALKKELGTDQLSDEQMKRVKSVSTTEFSLFKNNYPLPMGYCYSAYITKDMWDALDPVQKQETLLKAAYVDASFDDIQLYRKEIPDYTVPYEIEYYGSEITPTEFGVITTSDRTTATIQLKNTVTDAEIYVGIKDLTFTPTTAYELYFGGDNVDPLRLYNKTNWINLSKSRQQSIRRDRLFKSPRMETYDIEVNDNYVKKNIGYLQPESCYSDGRHDLIVNLGYREEMHEDITLTFDERGVYSFDELSVYAIPMAGYSQKISNLSSDSLQDISLDTNTFTGNVSLDSSKLLCVAIPYSPGWEAYVDEMPSEVYCLNEHYIGLHLPQGTHAIRLSYSTPYKKEGAIMSLIGVFALIAVAIIDKKRPQLVRNK